MNLELVEMVPIKPGKDVTVSATSLQPEGLYMITIEAKDDGIAVVPDSLVRFDVPGETSRERGQSLCQQVFPLTGWYLQRFQPNIGAAAMSDWHIPEFLDGDIRPWSQALMVAVEGLRAWIGGQRRSSDWGLWA